MRILERVERNSRPLEATLRTRGTSKEGNVPPVCDHVVRSWLSMNSCHHAKESTSISISSRSLVMLSRSAV